MQILNCKKNHACIFTDLGLIILRCLTVCDIKAKGLKRIKKEKCKTLHSTKMPNQGEVSDFVFNLMIIGDFIALITIFTALLVTIHFILVNLERVKKSGDNFSQSADVFCV